MPFTWYDHDADNPPFFKALADLRHRATLEGWCYQHVQAIVVAIDQYAEAATGNREFFQNRPQKIAAGLATSLEPDRHRSSLKREAPATPCILRF